MYFIIAPDSYKGSLSAMAVAKAMKEGVSRVFPAAGIDMIPIADGGEGTVEALTMATGGRVIHTWVKGPLGEDVQAFYGILGDGETAVIEMAAASGLSLISAEQRDPRITTTYGTGQLIIRALDHGVRKIIIGIGGSATNDGGTGMARALGVKFLDSEGLELPDGGMALANLQHVDISGLDPRVLSADIVVACDVDNPLCGPRGASAVYGPQKGADKEMITKLDATLQHLAAVVEPIVDKCVATRPGAGAAGGLGAGLMWFTNAQLRPGIDIVLEAALFAQKVQNAQLVFTGEGRTDFQTAFGKAPVGVAKIAQKYGVPTVCLAGSLGEGCEDVLEQGIGALASAVCQPMSLEECIAAAEEMVRSAAERTARMIKLGMGIRE